MTHVLCSRCSLTVVATIPEDVAPPPLGLGVCGPCGLIKNGERVATELALVQTQLATYETLAQLQGLPLADLPVEPAERHAVLKGLLGL